MAAWIERLRARRQGLLDALGWSGALGIAAAALAAGVALLLVVPLRAELARLGAQAESDAGRPGGGRLSASPARDELASFYGFFPAQGALPEWLGRIHAIAAAQGVQVPSGEYRLERTPSPRLARYRMTLPVQGTYAQIRGFVGAVLDEVPAAAVEEVTLNREGVTAQRLEARVRITLYLGSP